MKCQFAAIGSFALLVVLATILSPVHANTAPKETKPALKIIKDELRESDKLYSVKGIVYNPHDKPVKNVMIKYFIWKKWMGQDGHGSFIRDTGGLVQAAIKFIPPKQSVEFTAVGATAPVMTVESGMLPDPLYAEVTAEWDR